MKEAVLNTIYSIRNAPIPDITPKMGLEELHNDTMFYLAIILFAISWVMVFIIINFKNKKIPNKYVNHGTLVELIWTISPALILILIVFPLFKLLILIDVVLDPAQLIYGEGNEWYWNYQYQNTINTDEESVEYDSYIKPESDLELGMYQLFMDVADMIHTDPWSDPIPDMVQYAQWMEQYKGRPLHQAYITLDRNGPRTRINVLTWYFHEKDPGAFLYYDKHNTPINDHFLHRAQILNCKTKEEKIPVEFLRSCGVSDLKKLPSEV